MSGTLSFELYYTRILDRFENICQLLHASYELAAQDNQIRARLLDERGRFRVWAHNVGAHRSGKSSLDHRLREAPKMRSSVFLLLQDVERFLAEGSIPAYLFHLQMWRYDTKK